MGGRGSAGGTRSTYRGGSTADFAARGLDANGSKSLFNDFNGNRGGSTGTGGGSSSGNRTSTTGRTSTGGTQSSGGSSGGGGGSTTTTTKSTDTTDTSKQVIPPDANLKDLFEESDLFDELLGKGLSDAAYKTQYQRYYTRWLTENGLDDNSEETPELEIHFTTSLIPSMQRVKQAEFEKLPKEIRDKLAQAGLKVNVGHRADGHPRWDDYARETGTNTSTRVGDGRTVGTLSFYDGNSKDIFISTGFPGGSRNVMVHEMGHAVDDLWLDEPVEVEHEGLTSTVSEISRDDPYWVDLHNTHLVPHVGEDDWFDYFINGPSGGSHWADGRSELFAEGLACYYEGGKLAIVGFLANVITDSAERSSVADKMIAVWSRYGIV